MRYTYHASLLAAAVVALACAMFSSAADSPKSNSVTAPVRCTANTQHPIRVSVTALDPVARGAVVRLVVSASSAVALDQVEARMTSTGGASNLGPSTIVLGPISQGTVRQASFTVSVPSTGGRQYVQFLVVGQGPNGSLSRGACYNLLPDGPAETGRLVVTPQGARVLEVRAGRIN